MRNSTRAIRQLVLIMVCALASACSTITPAPIQELSHKEVLVSDHLGEFIKTLPDPAILQEVNVEQEVPVPTPEPEVVVTPVIEDTMTRSISDNFKLQLGFVENIVNLAKENAYPVFPDYKDILAIIAVESSYNVKAKLRGSYGLMQIEKKSHLKKIAGRSLFSPAVNIEVGAAVLNEYYNLVKGDKKGAILAYNAGIGNYLKRRYKLEYYRKFLKERAKLK